MTQEQKAAMERLRTAKAFRGGYSCPWECTAVYTEGQGKPSVRMQYTLDLEIAADAYLAIVPANDDLEPVWFAVYRLGDRATLRIGICGVGRWGVFVRHGSNEEFLLSEVSNRGDVRRLLEALGVTT